MTGAAEDKGTHVDVRFPIKYSLNPMHFALPHQRTFFYFMGEGSTKILGAQLVGGMMTRLKKNEPRGGFWLEPDVRTHAKALLSSILRIGAARARADMTPVQLDLHCAAQQAAAAQVQALSPFQWAILIRKHPRTTVAEFVALFNAHPSVIAHGGALQFSPKRHALLTNIIEKFSAPAFAKYVIHLSHFHQAQACIFEALLDGWRMDWKSIQDVTLQLQQISWKSSN